LLERTLAGKISEQRKERAVIKEAFLAKKSPSQKDLETIFKMTNEMDSIEQYYSTIFKDSSENYNLLVEKAVNDLVYQYGLKHEYTYLYSPATSNSFMYADSSLDVTTAVITYINEQMK
jgi:Skp family chaperone for outer membrane proteins